MSDVREGEAMSVGPGDDSGEDIGGGWDDEGGWFSDDSGDDSGEGEAHF